MARTEDTWAHLAEENTINAKSFDINVGDPILFGKYLNKPGRITDFGTSEKGDPTVIVEPDPTGRKQEKELKLFRLRYDKNRIPSGTPETKVASRYMRRVLASVSKR